MNKTFANENIGTNENKRNLYTTDVIKKTTNVSNNDLIELCKLGIIKPQKTNSGQVCFSASDYEIIKKMKTHPFEGVNKNEQLIVNKQTDKKEVLSEYKQNIDNKVNEIKLPKLNEPKNIQLNNITTRIEKIEKTICKKLEELIDEKLDGLDEVIVELIQTKTEITNLRSKINQLELDNHKLTNDLTSYKEIGFGFYIKKN